MKRLILSLSALLMLAGLAGALVGCSKPTTSNGATKKTATLAAGANLKGTPKEGMPEGLPVWEGATVKDSTHKDSGQFDAYELELTIASSFETVKNGVAAGLKDAGWAPEILDEQTDSLVISATKGNVEATYTIAAQTGGGVTLVISTQTTK